MLKTNIYLIPVLITLVFCIIIYSLIDKSSEIITLRSWQHGMAVCQNEVKNMEMSVSRDFTTWAVNGVIYMVESNHLDDTELNDLEYLAGTKCN